MITFETQQDFEDAVMGVLGDRLSIILQRKYNSNWTDNKSLHVILRDESTRECIDEDTIDF